MNRQSQLGIGLSLGFFLPILALWFLFQLRPELIGIQQFDYDVVRQLNVQLLSLGLLLNGAAFFLALRFNKELISRGILIASVIAMLFLIIYRFLL